MNFQQGAISESLGYSKVNMPPIMRSTSMRNQNGLPRHGSVSNILSKAREEAQPNYIEI